MSLDSKVAIIGMDAFFGKCDGLDTLERSIYEGKQYFQPLPPKRWYGIETQTDLLQEYGLPEGKAPVGAYITDFEVDTLAYKIPPNEVEKLNPQQLLLLKVADRALKDAKIAPGGNVAVIVAAETELSVHQLQQRWNLSWQIKDGLNKTQIALPEEKLTQLETIVKDSIHHQVELGEYLSYINNVMASRISTLGNFTGPSFTISAGEMAVFKGLELAQMLLTSGEVDAVVLGAVDLACGVENVLLRSQWATMNTGVNTLSFDQNVNGWMVGEGAGVVVLKSRSQALADGNHIYAVIDAVSIGQSTLAQVCNQAFQEAGIQPQVVNYVEVCGSGVPQEDELEIAGLLQAYPSVGNGLHCAIGSVKANIGNTFVASGMASLIKTALCLYYRYIPATPNWSGVKNPEIWQGSNFYVATESRPWFVDKGGICRVAAVNGIGLDGTYAHVILAEETSQKERDKRYLQHIPFYLFPVAVGDGSRVSELLEQLKQTIEGSECLSAAASQTYSTFIRQSQTEYALAITGRNQKELLKEIESAKKGVTQALEQGKDWQTPMGSYFTSKPLGKTGAIAYVYPAAVNSYIGIGRTMFRLFPQVFDDLKSNNLYDRAADVDKLLYPRSLAKLSTRQLETLEKELLADSLGMFESEIAIARYMTAVFRDDFQVKPQYAFGYSLGETSMMVAQGVWSDFEGGSNTLNSSPLFGEQLSGPKNAVREYWGVTEDKFVWSNYVLIATPAQVRESIKHEKYVYLTQINTPEEVLIAGEESACQRVIQALNCNAFLAPFDHVIHCPAMRSAYGEIKKVNTLPTQNVPGVVFYSAAAYQPIVLESEAIAHSIATGLCQELDFPRLVNRLWADGTRIFIEAGAGNICSRWIGKILEAGETPKEHVTVALNRRGTDDHTSLVRALAKLLSHGVNLDLTPLYDLTPETTKLNKSALRTITLGGNSILESILSEENRQLFSQDLTKSPVNYQGAKIVNSLKGHYVGQVTRLEPGSLLVKQPVGSSSVVNDEIALVKSNSHPPAKAPTKTIIDNGFLNTEKLQSSELSTQTQLIPSSLYVVSEPCLNMSQYQKLSANNSKLTKAHTNFLQARQDFSQQMREIIQLQLVCAQNLLNEEPNQIRN
jgi:PfaB family protein